MPLEITWYIPDQVWLVRFSGDVTHEDMRDYDKQLDEMLRGRTEPVCLIHDLAAVESFPLNWTALTHVLKTPRRAAIAHTANIIPTQTALTEAIADFFARVFRQPAYNAPSLDTALAYLCEQAPHLKNLLPKD